MIRGWNIKAEYRTPQLSRGGSSNPCWRMKLRFRLIPSSFTRNPVVSRIFPAPSLEVCRESSVTRRGAGRLALDDGGLEPADRIVGALRNVSRRNEAHPLPVALVFDELSIQDRDEKRLEASNVVVHPGEVAF